MDLMLIVILLLIGVLGLLLIRLWRDSNRLRNELHSMQLAIRGLGNDLAGLCQAGVTQDNRISEHEQELNRLVERIEDLGHRDQSGRSFHAAISAARKGVDAQTLIESYGISQDAAELLIRLHGSPFECEN